MAADESDLALLHDPRLAALATSTWPAWLWSVDGSRILWANAIGAVLFGTADTAECAARRFDVKDAAAAQIIRLAATLPSIGAVRLERLRGFGSGFGRALTCACSRFVLPSGGNAILVAATEPAGPALPLSERVRRLFGDDMQPVAAFTPDGSLVHATSAARAQLGESPSLPALDLAAAAAAALAAGSASGSIRSGEARLDAALTRLGDNADRVILLTLPPRPQNAAGAASGSRKNAPPMAATAPAQPSPGGEPAAERRHPLRFVWQMDADGHFALGSDELIEILGPGIVAAVGRRWSEIAAELNLDPDNQVARALASHETWSGIVTMWPVDEGRDRLPVELSGLPVFDRARAFRGYRGFGVCRDIARINQLLRARRERPMGFMPAPDSPAPLPSAAETPSMPQGTPAPEPPPVEVAAKAERPALSIAPVSANVVPFR